MPKLTTASSIPRGLDLSRLDDAVAKEILRISDGEVTHSYGYGAATLGGDYTLSAQGNILSGTVTSVTFSVGPKDIFTLSGLDIQGTVAQSTLAQTPGETMFSLLMAGADSVTGSKWRDVLDGQDGNDILRGGNSSDTIHGGNGNDRLLGQNGPDQLYGDAGNDRLFGGYGKDMLSGGTGRDLLMGLGGDDTLIGGAGFDRLIGGNGDDAFVFEKGFGRDRVNDFKDGDSIVLGDSFWKGIESGKDLVKVYGEINDNGDAVLSFGNADSVVFIGVEKLSQLFDAIERMDFI